MFQTFTYFLTCSVNGIDTESKISPDPTAVPAPTLSKNSGVILMDRCVPDGCTRQRTIERKLVKPWSQDWLIAAGAYPGFCSMKRLEVFLRPLDGMLFHRRPLPRNLLGVPQQFAGTHLYTWVERSIMRVKCLAQEHNTMSLARARTRTARSGIERTNHEATAPPTL